MKTIIAALALSTAVATGAFAQSAGGAADSNPSAATGATAGTRPAVTMDQQTRIRTYWRSARPAAVTMSGSVSMGESIPTSVELRSFPNDVNMTNYRYVVVGENMYVVDPGTRKVVHVMQ
jgi:hypothetical protein